MAPSDKIRSTLSRSRGVDDLGTDGHVVRSEPTAHTFVLQVSVEALDESVILLSRGLAHQGYLGCDRSTSMG
jgi:hypothetical protein